MKLEELAGRVMKAKLEGRDYITLGKDETKKLSALLGWDQRFITRGVDVTLSDIERWISLIKPERLDFFSPAPCRAFLIMNDAEFLDDLEAKALHRHVEDNGQMWLSKADTDRLLMLLGCQPDEGMFAGFDYPAHPCQRHYCTQAYIGASQGAFE